MSTKAPAGSKKEFKLVPAGTHLARCFGFIHVGHVPNTYPNATTPTVNKIRLTWELPEEKEVFKEGAEPQPFSISQDYTLSMNEKSNLRKIVQSWFGKTMTDEEAADFDVESLVGLECLLTIAHQKKTDKTFAVVQNITQLPKAMKCPDGINKQFVITWENLDEATYNGLPEFIQNKLKEASEYPVWCQKHNVESVAF